MYHNKPSYCYTILHFHHPSHLIIGFVRARDYRTCGADQLRMYDLCFTSDHASSSVISPSMTIYGLGRQVRHVHILLIGSVLPSSRQTPGPSCPCPPDRPPSGYRPDRHQARHAHVLQIVLPLVTAQHRAFQNCLIGYRNSLQPVPHKRSGIYKVWPL